MRILMCGVAAIALSGCSWLGLGSGQSYSNSTYQGGHYKQSSAQPSYYGGKRLSRTNVEAGFGPEFIVGGQALSGSRAAGNVAGFADLGTPTTARDVSMKDAYKTGVRATLGISHAFDHNTKFTGEGYYSKSSGKDMTFAEQDGVAINGRLSDYKAFGVEAGLRQYFRPQRAPLVKSIRPYVEAKLGAALVDDIALENIRGLAATDARTPTSLRLYENTIVPTAAGLIGLETVVANRFTMGLETGIRYSADLEAENRDFFVPANAPVFNTRYAGINNGGDRLTVPVTIRGRYRF